MIARRRSPVGLVGLLGSIGLLLACTSATGLEEDVHGGPGNPAPDGSYTEAVTSPTGVASLESITLGGVEQWILVRGQDTSNPVLVFLHGGPGSPAIRYGRFAFKSLEEDFTVVTWDQRGCGKSYHAGIDPQSLTFDRLLADAHELILQMRDRFGIQKVFLMGVSWGAMLGIRLADTHPELVHAFVGIGQPVNVIDGLGIAIAFAIQRATVLGEDEAVVEFTALRELWLDAPSLAWEQAGLLQAWLESHGYGDLHDLSLYASLAQEAGPLTEYTAEDQANEDRWQALYDASPLRQDASWLLAMDLLADVPRLDVPAVFMNGRYDYKAPLELVDAYVASLTAPEGKRLIAFEQSAHVVFLEERALFRNSMIEVLATYRG